MNEQMSKAPRPVQFGVREVWPESQVVGTWDIQTVGSEIMSSGLSHYSF